MRGTTLCVGEPRRFCLILPTHRVGLWIGCLVISAARELLDQLADNGFGVAEEHEAVVLEVEGVVDARVPQSAD